MIIYVVDMTLYYGAGTTIYGKPFTSYIYKPIIPAVHYVGFPPCSILYGGAIDTGWGRRNLTPERKIN